MDENAKNKLILILIMLTSIFFVISISSCSNSFKQRHARDKEMATRLDLEEKMSKFSQERKSLEQRLNAATQGLEEEKTAHEVTKKALLQEQLVSQSLKEELQKITKLKEALEEDLKEALVASKSKTKK